MTSRDFIYWLQGYFELNDPKTIDEKTIKIIRNHVNLVFKYEIDPSYSDDPKVQAELQAIHDGEPFEGDDLSGDKVDITEWRPENQDIFPPYDNNPVFRC